MAEVAGAEDISHIECIGWRSALWYSFLLWSLLVLQWWSSLLATSICSVRSSAWLCLGDWWGLLFGSVMTRDWVHGVGHSPVCQILLQIVVRVVITSSPPAWTSYAGMFSTPADFLFFNDWTAASTSLQRMGWSSSVSVWGQFSTYGSPLTL